MFDIQDIGARFYTYIWTLYDTMVAAAKAGKRFVVLDRPNATAGRQALGPVMHAGYETFVGRKPISQAHGMTVGELARMYNGEWVAGDAGRTVELTVIEMDGWFRDMYYEQTSLPWVPPSPNIPTVDTAVVYRGTGMFEGTNLSEGRGTTRPFEEISAPFGDWHWRDALTALDLPGAAFRESYVSPTFSKYAGQTVGGVELYVTDRDAYDPIRTGIAMLVTAKRVYPNGFSWHSGVNPDTWIDNLTGSRTTCARPSMPERTRTPSSRAGRTSSPHSGRCARNTSSTATNVEATDDPSTDPRRPDHDRGHRGEPARRLHCLGGTGATAGGRRRPADSHRRRPALPEPGAVAAVRQRGRSRAGAAVRRPHRRRHRRLPAALAHASGVCRRRRACRAPGRHRGARRGGIRAALRR
jgi:hypothetical protein